MFQTDPFSLIALFVGLSLVAFVAMVATSYLKIGGAFAICPALSDSMIPGVARRAAVLGMAIFVIPPMMAHMPPGEPNVWMFSIVAAKEAVLGFMIGFFAAVPFWIAENVGNFIDNQRGATMGEKMDVPKRRHRVVCVALSTGPNKIVDVGIGMPFVLSPLDLVFDVPQPRDGKVYRIVRHPVLTCLVQVQKRDGTWANLFSFDTAPQLPVDFAYVHWWCETHPESQFRQKVWVFLPQRDGASRSIALVPDPETGESALTFALTAPDGMQTKTILRDEEALAFVLKEQFGIVEREVGCLPRPVLT